MALQPHEPLPDVLRHHYRYPCSLMALTKAELELEQQWYQSSRRGTGYHIVTLGFSAKGSSDFA